LQSDTNLLDDKIDLNPIDTPNNTILPTSMNEPITPMLIEPDLKLDESKTVKKGLSLVPMLNLNKLNSS